MFFSLMDVRLSNQIVILFQLKQHPLNRGYDTPDPVKSILASPGTPAWLKKGLVRMKSLDYRFSDDNTAIYTKKQKQLLRNQEQFESKKLDAHAYRQKILESRKQGGLATSAGNIAIGANELRDVTKSPGYRREKLMDRQLKRERTSPSPSSSNTASLSVDRDSSKSSFSQCTFNMANILMCVFSFSAPHFG